MLNPDGFPASDRQRCLSALACLTTLALGLTASVIGTARAAAPCATPPVSFVRQARGKNFVVANGRPYLLYGVQIRIDHIVGEKVTPASLTAAGSYFQHARSVGFHTVVVPVRWSYLEPTEGRYDFSYLDTVINDARTNDLDVQILWYGSDVCGWNLVPSYVANDRTRFPRNRARDVFFDLSNPRLIAKEKAAVSAMMAYIAVRDTAKRVIMVQVENEPDGAGSLTGSLKWGDAADMKAKMFAGDQFPAVMALLDTLGKAVHAGPRPVVTRCNIGTPYRALDAYAARPTANPGIDIYGVDTYSTIPTVTKKALNVIPVTAGNVAHQPEGGGRTGNLINLTLSDFEEGGGFLIYELRSYDDGDNGIYRHASSPDDWTERDGTLLSSDKRPENKTSQIRDFNRLIYKADQKIAVAPKGDCAAFNVDGHAGHWTETRMVGTIPLTYETWSGSPAFALRDANNDLILMSLTDGNVFTVAPSYVHGKDVSVGYYDAADQWHEQYRKAFKGRTLLMWKGEVVRVPAHPAPTRSR